MKFMQQFADTFSLVLSGDGGGSDQERDIEGIWAGTGVQALRNSHGGTIVFGDYLNDLDMLRLRRTVMPWPMHIRK